jgi:glyoxylate reductase
MAKVVSTSPLFPDEVDRLESAHHRVELPDDDRSWSRARVLEELADAEALICLLTDRVDDPMLEAATALRIVANVAVGFENIDVDAAARRGILVTNTPGVLTEATADLAFALALAASRRVAEADAALREGSFPPWSLHQPLLGQGVHGKTLGIVGMGRIGSAMARRGAGGFSMRVLYHSRHRNLEAESEARAVRVPFERLLADSDIVSLHVPLTETTRHLFDGSALGRMKRSAILVNTARGAIVDEAALARALHNGTIAGAGIDVFEEEPRVHPDLLAQRERVVLTPHLGSATRETREAMLHLAVDNVLDVLAGKPPRTPVTTIGKAP